MIRIPAPLPTAGALVMLALLTGCTIGAVPSTPTLANTTSAEQAQRIFWNDVKQQKWLPVQGLLVSNVTWRNGKDLLAHDAVLPYLQQLRVKDFLITNLAVKSNEADMTVTYDLQLTTGTSPQPMNLHAVSVWQQVPPPPDNASKQVKKEAHKASPYLLTVEDLAPGQ